MLRSPSLRRSHSLGVQRKLRTIEKCQFAVLPQFRDANNNKFNLGTAGPALNAQAGSTATADTNDPTYYEAGDTYDDKDLIERTCDGPTDELQADDYFEVADNATLDVTATDSFMALFAGRTYDPTPAAVEDFFNKQDGIATAAGWSIYSTVADARVRARIADGSVGRADASAGNLIAGQAFVAGSVRDAGTTIEAFLDGTASGSPVTDTTSATLANSEPVRIGADGGTPGLFAAVEHFGSAFWNVHDNPAPTDKEVEMGSHQLARATGRSI